MYILDINGSPRLGMNTDNLCDAFIEEAYHKGHTVTKFSVAGKKINGCISCMQCYKNGPCCQKDDMIPLYNEIEKADMIVLASPICFHHITSQLKAVIDLIYALIVGGKFNKKDIATVFVSGDGSEYSNETSSFYKIHR